MQVEMRKVNSRNIRALINVRLEDYDPALDPKAVIVSCEIGEHVIALLNEEVASIGDMIKRVSAIDNVGSITQTDLQLLLRNPDRLPEEWRRFIMIATRAIARGPFASRFVPCAYFEKNLWHMGFIWIDGGGADRLVTCA